ncbi:hypothetical protein PanWU01x14_093900 [Parasponia andersonii]|uniref:Uncharacterized protein n=1 Tax=Parasponia andersonii TaxID=3476 RepID=A0A2P5D679_PARAD|nr:hypothetical protein PanWU01x14_093900 [Parasponia andersonii]
MAVVLISVGLCNRNWISNCRFGLANAVVQEKLEPQSKTPFSTPSNTIAIAVKVTWTDDAVIVTATSSIAKTIDPVVVASSAQSSFAVATENSLPGPDSSFFHLAARLKQASMA